MDSGKVNVTQTKLTWVIRDFERKARRHKKLISPSFSVYIERDKTKWELIMTSTKDEDGEEYFGIYLYDDNEDYYRMTIEFALLNVCDEEVYQNIFDDDSRDRKKGFPLYIKKDELLNEHKDMLLHNNQLTIICTITNDVYIEVEKCKIEDQARESLRLEELDHLSELFQNGTHSDVVFSVEGKEIHAHKCIIANRSLVFDAMFKHDMKEARENTINVEDITYSAMHDLLHFIYSGKVPLYDEDTRYDSYKDLMIAANKYGIKNLQILCEKRLADNLHVDNVFESLNLADAHNAVELKESAIDFIVSNGDEIIESPAYKEFGKLHPEISCQVFRALIIKRNRNE